MEISGGGRRIAIDLAVVALIAVGAWYVLFRRDVPKPPRGIESIELIPRRLWDPGAEDLADWRVIGGPRDILWIPPGELLISDGERSQVLRLRTTGELIEVIGRSGQGPGEFGEPWDLAYDRTTATLWIGDRGTGRMSVSRFRLAPGSSEFIDRIQAQQFRIQSTASLTVIDSETFWIIDPFQWRNDLKRIHRVDTDGNLVAHFGEIYQPEGERPGGIGRRNEGLLEAVGRDTLVFLWESRPLLEIWTTRGERLLEKTLELPEIDSVIAFVDWINRSGSGPQGANIGDVVPVFFGGVVWQPSSGQLFIMAAGIARQGLTPMEPYATLAVYAFDQRTMEAEKRYFLPEFLSGEFAPHCLAVSDTPEKLCFFVYDFSNGVIVALEPDR